MNEITTINPTGVEIQSEETMPHSIEAEQQLLGAILTNNDVYDRIASIIGARHFYEPVHARIFDIAAARIAKNNLASPVTLKAFMEDDEGLQELGGAAYLVRLAGAAVSAFAVRDYAQMIYDLAVRRDLIGLGRDISAKAARVDVASEPREQIVEAEQKLYKLAEQGQTEGVGHQQAALRQPGPARDHHRSQSRRHDHDDVGGVLDPEHRLSAQQQVAQGAAANGGHQRNHDHAEQIKAELAETQAERDKVLAEANQKAQEMIADAKEAAKQVGEAEGQKAVKQAEEIIRKAREATDADRDRMMSELRAEIGRLVVETTAKVTGKVLTTEDQQRLIDDTNRELAA